MSKGISRRNALWPLSNKLAALPEKDDAKTALLFQTTMAKSLGNAYMTDVLLADYHGEVLILSSANEARKVAILCADARIYMPQST